VASSKSFLSVSLFINSEISHEQTKTPAISKQEIIRQFQ
jgi:hypothetical protein